MSIITGTSGSEGTDYTGSTGLTETEISEAIVKADEYDPTKIPSLEGDVVDIQGDISTLQTGVVAIKSDISTLQTSVTSLKNSGVRSSIVVPIGSWWSVAYISLGEFTIQITSQQSNTSNYGLGVKNLSGKTVYLNAEYSYMATVSSVGSAITTSVARYYPTTSTTITVGAENYGSAASYARYRLMFSSYGSAAPITDVLQIDVTVARYDSSNRLFVFRSELVDG